MPATRLHLTAAAPTAEVGLEQDWNGALSAEYLSGTGTFVLEASNSGTNWYPLKMHMYDETVADSLAAPAIGYVEVTSWSKIRARLTGSGDLLVAVNTRTG